MLSLVNSVLPLLCLSVGFFVGYSIKNNKPFEVPEPIKHPHKYIKAKIKDKQIAKEVQEEIDYLNDVLYNIENYDGTGQGQRTVKRGESN